MRMASIWRLLPRGFALGEWQVVSETAVQSLTGERLALGR